MKQFHVPYSVLPESAGSQSLGKDDLRWLEAFLTNLNVSSRATVPTPVNATDAATKQYVDDRLAQLTVEEVDGSPSISIPTTIRLDQADGFVLTNPSSGVARVDLAAVPNSVLANSSVTVSAGGGLSGGGAVALGASVTLSLTAHDHQGAGTQGGTLDAAAIVTGLLAVTRGGTGIGLGTSGGVLAFTAAGTIASSAALTLNGVVLGGGAGVAPSSTGAGVADEVLRVPSAGGAPAFGTIVTSGIANDAVTDIKLRNSAAVSVIGRSAGTSGDPADIAAAADNDVLRRSGGLVGFGTLDVASIGSGTLPVARGGTNSATALNNSRIMVSSGGGIVEAAALTNGQFLIGSIGAAPVAANLTAGSNITITNAAGAVTIAATAVAATSATADVSTRETTTSTTYTDLATSGPAVTLSPGSTKDQIILLRSNTNNNTDATQTFASVAVAGVAAIDADAMVYELAGTNSSRHPGFSVVRAASVTNGSTHTMKYRVDAGTGGFGQRRIVAYTL